MDKASTKISPIRPIRGLLFLSMAILLSLILGSCSKYTPITTPEPLNFQLGELLLEPSSLPSSWRVSDRGSDFGYDQGQDEDRYIEFTTENFNSPTTHTVF